MRTVALGALALATGCNQIFGLDPVVLTDAQVIDVHPDAVLPRMRLSAITPRLGAGGEVLGSEALVAIAPVPRLQYGPIGGALVDTAFVSDTELTVDYAYAERGEPWRFVYTLDGGVPHEVHWQPTVLAPGHAAVLRLTPPDRAAVTDPNAAFALTVMPADTTYVEPRIYTTNAWTETLSPTVMSGTVTARYGMAVTRPIAGVKRKPDPANDRVVLLEILPVDPPSGGECSIANESAVFRKDLDTGMSLDTVPPGFSTVPTKQNWTLEATDIQEIGINLALGHDVGIPADLIMHRLVTLGPAGGIPLLEHATPGVPLPVPVGMTLLRCTGLTSIAIPSFHYPTAIAVSLIATMQLASPPQQLAEGPQVAHGAVTSIEANSGNAFQLRFEVALPIEPQIEATSVKLEGQAAPIAIPGAGATATLTFTNGAPYAADFYEIILHRIDGGTLRRVREFTVPTASLVFDRDQGLPAGTKYVFEIRAIKGSRQVTVSDYTDWASDQRLAVTWTQSFTL